MSSSSYQSSSDKQDKKEEPPKSRFKKTHYCGYQNERLNNASSIMDSVNDHHELSSLGLNDNLLHKVAVKGAQAMRSVSLLQTCHKWEHRRANKTSMNLLFSILTTVVYTEGTTSYLAESELRSCLSVI